MNPILTNEQLQAILANPEGPVRVVNPQNHETYVIVRADVYEQMERILRDEYHISDTYLAQAQSALRAGWDDPAMDEYENYDDNYKKLCQ
jgi:hypothetical protein